VFEQERVTVGLAVCMYTPAARPLDSETERLGAARMNPAVAGRQPTERTGGNSAGAAVRPSTGALSRSLSASAAGGRRPQLFVGRR